MFTDTRWANVEKKFKNRRHTDPQTSSYSSESRHSDIIDDFCNSTDTMSPSLSEGESSNIGGGEYFLPSNSDKEIERLQMQHFLMRCIWKENFSSPIKEDFIKGGVKKDVYHMPPSSKNRCGSGVWITDLATEFTASTFIGVDGDEARARIQIELPNAAYLHHDLLDELPFPENTFDFVNQRFFTMASEEKWRNYVLPEIIRVTKTGGYMEFMEMGNWQEMGKVTKRMTKAYDDYMETRGVYRLNPSSVEKTLRSTNLIKNIKCDSRISPFWGGQASRLICRNQIEKIAVIRSDMCKFLNISEREFNEMIEAMHEEVRIHKTFSISYRYVEERLGESIFLTHKRPPTDSLPIK
ncbi:9576_t:CDS:2 [Acaulospora colombiana]|uniref:9576_t:CDS:1 n=1 Tax=Acaulospora colombiana TaxID=27376 RepID=A0ACA9K3Y3_9GLOM|nr:9576_t:CDS:2 [Acaulospora colombiana]